MYLHIMCKSGLPWSVLVRHVKMHSHGVVIGSTLDLFCVSSLFHLVMLVVPDAKIQIDKIYAWKQSHDGELPKKAAIEPRGGGLSR